ncbi:MAG: hypothetical protein JXB88_19535 [Spirochaetales bacterium]|nr:hypothetical protein [Spirochaetales bacterium]
MTLNGKISIILLFIISTSLYSSDEEIVNQFNHLFITGYFDAPENIKSDNNLNFVSFGIKSFTITEWGLRTGGGINLLISTREFSEGENSFIYGGLFTGFFLGQELRIWQIIFSVNLFLGAGVSISNLLISPWHVDYFGEINTEIGIIIMENFSISFFAGFQSAGNLFPQFPGSAYLMYYPVWGIGFTWL